MARVKGALATRKRRKKVLKLAKGYWGSKSRHFKMAKQAVMKSGNYAYIGRKQKKRDFRRLWISRINAACRANGTTRNGIRRRRDRHRGRSSFQGTCREGKGFCIIKLSVRPEFFRAHIF